MQRTNAIGKLGGLANQSWGLLLAALLALLLAATIRSGSVAAQVMPIVLTEVRVRLAGALADGTVLRHTRQDQRGIWVNLPARDWVMVLLADTDGLVFPDLGLDNAGAPDAGDATAIARGALPTVYPTAPVVTPVSPTSLPRSEIVQEPTDVPETGVHHSSLEPASNTSGVGLLMLLITMIAGVVWLSSRHKL
jgi:hypothetical protein